ncbi:hypothetical protein [Naasia sp. SYSU D00948]|uniref:hypothetical protein n=1 Tax=Naasia sp. SYSU D00948 TaxID=2817379 RepID=UPI001B314B22|nr:hypothetical protein [Naasia sp. SYSU D00948]
MTRQLTVASASDAPFAEQLAAIVTLPESLREASGPADLIGIRGAAGWPAVAADAIRSGARGILVVAPVAADTAELEALATERRVPVVLDSPWAGNPAVAQSAPPFSALLGPGSLVEARADLPVGSDPEQGALDLLALVRRAVAPAAGLRVVRRGRTGWDAVAAVEGGASATLGVVLTDSLPPSATVRILGPVDSVVLTVPAPAAAAPGRVLVGRRDGETLLETRYETAHRAAWRRLHALVLDGEDSDDLAGFAADLRLLREAPGPARGSL